MAKKKNLSNLAGRQNKGVQGQPDCQEPKRGDVNPKIISSGNMPDQTNEQQPASPNEKAENDTSHNEAGADMTCGSKENRTAEDNIETAEGNPTAEDNNKKERPAKPKKSLMVSIAGKLGYEKRSIVEGYLAEIYETIGEDMDEQLFETLSLEQKFSALAESLTLLMANHAAELEQERGATAEAKKEVEKQTLARATAEADASTNGQKATDANRRVEAAETTIESLKNNIEDLKKQVETVQDLEKANKELEENSNIYKTDLEKQKNDNSSLRTQVKDLNKNINDLNIKNNDLSGELNKLQGAYSDLEGSYGSLHDNHVKLSKTYQECKELCEKLKESEVGQLSAELTAKENEIKALSEAKENALKEKEKEITALSEAKENAEADKVKTEGLLETARQTIESHKNKLEEERATVKELRLTVASREEDIQRLNSQAEKDSNEIHRLNTELDNRKNIITEKDKEIEQLGKDNATLQTEKENLEQTVSGLEKDKASLTEANEVANQQLSEKADFIRSERNEFAKTMMSLAKALSEASAKDFLGCCDNGFESNRVSLQEKVAKPIRAFEREMAEIDPEKYTSRDELVDAYHALVKAQFDEASGLTRIAQWYAYSHVAFMADEDRSDGLFIRQQEINDIYDLAVKLMGNVGIAYSLPALYAERFPENGKYDDVTGQRQLNIEYMCPTARNHKENIDSTDISQVIIDVVEVGYTDSKGNRKKSRVII